MTVLVGTAHGGQEGLADNRLRSVIDTQGQPSPPEGHVGLCGCVRGRVGNKKTQQGPGGACTGPCAQVSLDVACGKDRGPSRVALTEGFGVRQTVLEPQTPHP